MEDTREERKEGNKTLEWIVREDNKKEAGLTEKRPVVAAYRLLYRNAPTCSFSMTSGMAETLAKKVVAQMLPGTAEWTLVYSSEKHGFSLNTLMRQSGQRKEQGGVFILSIMEHASSAGEYERVFGAIFSTKLEYSATPYGDVHTKLFRFSTRRAEGEDLKTTLHVYQAQPQEKGFYIMTKADYLAFGCSDARFGLRLEKTLLSGESHEVSTFHNDRLSHKNRFLVKQAELWHVQP